MLNFSITNWRQDLRLAESLAAGYYLDQSQSRKNKHESIFDQSMTWPFSKSGRPLAAIATQKGRGKTRHSFLAAKSRPIWSGFVGCDCRQRGPVTYAGDRL